MVRLNGPGVREIRDEEGWDIRTNNDSNKLKPEQYLLASEPSSEGDCQFARQMSSRLRAQVLERNGYTCQMCGVVPGELDAEGRGGRLHVRHTIDKIADGTDTRDNLKTLCSECNQGAKNLVTEPSDWIWLLGQIRRASRTDQEKALSWLTNKFRQNSKEN